MTIRDCNIFYYSGTGNSYLVAQEINKRLGQGEIYNLLEYAGEKLVADKIIIIFPVHMYGVPPVVLEFIRRIQIESKVRIYVICTCGGVPGETLWQVKKTLKERKMQLAGGYIIKMPRTYIVEFKVQSEAKQKKLIIAMYKKVSQIVKDVEEGKRKRFEVKEIGFGRVMHRLVYPNMMKNLNDRDKAFWVNSLCVGCKKCTQVCPVQNIEYKDGKLLWQHNCLMCFRCIHECSRGAIEYGNHTLGKKRYKNLDLKEYRWYKKSNEC